MLLITHIPEKHWANCICAILQKYSINKSIQARDTTTADCQLNINRLDSQTLWTSIGQNNCSSGQSPAGIKKAGIEIGAGIVCDYFVGRPSDINKINISHFWQMHLQ